MGKEVSTGEFFRGNFTLGEFARIPIRNSFYGSCFHFADSLLRVDMLQVIVWGNISPRLNYLENISVGRRDLSVEVEPDFLALFKKRSEIK